MEIENFTKKLKECKKSLIQTGYNDKIGNLKVLVSPDRKFFQIYREPTKKICPYCKTDLTKTDTNFLNINFYESQKNLSVFQAYTLYMIYKLNIIPYDYAAYHKCKAAIEFIKNIKDIN